MASRQVTFAPRKVAVALIFSVVVHSLLVLAGILARREKGERNPIAINCRVADGPGLFLDLTYSSGAKRKQEGGEEAEETIPVTVEPLRMVGVETGSVPRVEKPGGVDSVNAAGHRDGGGGGKGASLYGVPIKARRVVFVLDRSLSMGLTGAFSRAQAELMRCVRALPETSSFQIVLYNRTAEFLTGNRLIPASSESIAEVDRLLKESVPEGATDHVKAVSVALSLEPDAVFLVTDADDLTPLQVRELTRLNRTRTLLHTIDVSRRLRAASMLERLAQSNGGRHVRATGH